nr:hypothetical protein [Streptomyces sp. MST-110588]
MAGPCPGRRPGAPVPAAVPVPPVPAAVPVPAMPAAPTPAAPDLARGSFGPPPDTGYPAAPPPSAGHPAAPPPVADPRTSGVTGGPDVAAAVDEVRRCLDQGRITRAVDILGGILPSAADRHGAHSPVVRSLRKQYAATLMDDGQYRRALPELRLLADAYGRESGPGAARQALQFHYEAAQCLEQLGEATQALTEYRSLLPYFERYPDDPVRPLEIRRSIGHLLLALGEHGAAHETLSRLLYDAERVHGPGHAFPEEVRRTLYWLGQVRG